MGRKEDEVKKLIRRQIELIEKACICLLDGLRDDEERLKEVCEIEKEGDGVRREIALKLYEGAFLPGIRGNLYRLAETLDEVLDTMEDCVVCYLNCGGLEGDVKDYCIRIAEVNVKMARDLKEAFEALDRGIPEEATLRLRMREEMVDRIAQDLLRILMSRDVDSFWRGKAISDFILYLSSVSDVMEDAGDIIQILGVSLRA